MALNAQTYPALDVLVVDDASPDHRQPPHLKRIVKRHLRKRRWGFLRARRPLGFGGAVNWAMSRVRTDAELLLFLHDDVALDRDSVEHMVARMMADTAIAIVGPKIVAWDDPSRLEEVGMAVDRFGYPYKGLERGEIDLGQHDVASEVFYITSTCALVRHSVFRELRGWDGRMRAFSEDLDFCWRARVAGHSVMVEPRARARHAIALATGQRRSRFKPTRYYIRRNRLRAVAKNASGLRLVALVPQFVLLSLTEMVGFIVLRQPAEIFHLLRALGWNFISAPQTLTERVRVQRTRRISDGRLRRFTVRESTRLRAYVSAQTERLEDAWGRRTELVARRSREARAMTHWFAGWPAAAALLALAALVLGFRHFLWSPPAAVGELLPYPEGATALWRAYASPWQPSGLGAPGPTSPALLLLGVPPLLTFGAAGAAQKVLLVLLAATGFAGAYHLLAGVADRPSRLVAAVSYLLGPLGFAGVRTGALGALAFGAVAPFALRALLEGTGWTRPAGWDAGRGAARISLTAALAGAFVPGAIAFLAGAGVVLGLLRLLLVPAARTLAGALLAAGSALAGWLLLLPWSATWWEPGGALGTVMRDGGGSVAFRDHDMSTVLLGTTPGGPAALGLAFAGLAVVALMLGTGQRRRIALALVAMVVATGWAVTAFARGLVAAPVEGAPEAGVLAAVSFAGLAGLAAAAFRLDLPRRRLGWTQPVAIVSLSVAGALALAGLAPQIWEGGWSPGRGTPAAAPQVVERVRSLISAEAEREGPFRVLWAGESFAGDPSAGGRGSDVVVTGPTGETLADLFARGDPGATATLRSVTAAIEAGATDLGGQLLGAFNVRYVVLGREVDAAAWLAQRDLAVARREPEYLVLSSGALLPRAATFDRVPPYPLALDGADPALAAREVSPARSLIRRESSSRYRGRVAPGPGVVWLAESADRGWNAFAGDRTLRRVRAGWANSFALPEGGARDVRIVFETPPGRVAALIAIALAWIVVVGAAASKRPTSGSHGV